MEIFTIGHSNKTGEQLAEILKDYKIKTLVDVRSRPGSKYNPQFNVIPLGQNMRRNGILYEKRGHNIGGLDGNVNWDETIQELVARANSGEHIAIMCSEGDYKKCHRHTTIEPAINACGGSVAHILWKGGILYPASAKATSGGEQVGLDL